MKAAILFSGGKDSALTTLLLEAFFDHIELITFTFGQDESWKVAASAARQLGHSHRRIIFDKTVLDSALELLLSIGYPMNDDLNYVHSVAVETMAKEFEWAHFHHIEPLGENRVRFIDREEFNGLLVFTQTKDIDTNTKIGFEAMNMALKARAEAN